MTEPALAPHEIESIPNSGGGFTHYCRVCGQMGVTLAPTLPCPGSPGRGLSPDCSCEPFPHGTGPEIDCPVHGATCGCGNPIGLHPLTEIVTTGSGSTHTYWAKECLTAPVSTPPVIGETDD